MANRLSSKDISTLYDKISNWGRWGKEDERGALNFITDAKRAAAAKLVKTGQSVSLALPLATIVAPDNPTPVTHLMVETGFESHTVPVPWAGDYFAIAPHGMANTHLDALCHMFHKGKMYNGFSAEEVGAHGARRCAIDVTREGIVSRGVLLDIPRLRKKDWMEPGDRIFPEELDAAEKAHGVKVEEGDVLLIRTGRSAMRKAKGAWDPTRVGAPGLDAGCLEWLHDRKIAVLGSDSASDVMPSGDSEHPLPIHVGTIVLMGVHLIDNADFDALSEACARAGRYEFLFSMCPLILERGTASPVNPVAIL